MQESITAKPSTTDWESIIADLTTKQQTAREHIEQLRTQKRDLALEAAMGGTDARKKLDKANAELARLTLESDDWEAAIAQAQSRLTEARNAEATAAERARQAELHTLATAALQRAGEFTATLQQAAAAGAQLKLVIENMLTRATPGERRALDQLLLPGGNWQRAAEYAGLRNVLEFAGYPGPREHIVSLEDALTVHLARWLTTDKE